ncbi:fumarylacetoacetase [Sphingobium sp. TA15]|uniref:fumarylacetoacetase n=1 Tax=Sphingobium indicum (strain DSM 16413 / CCM 7287 / MTCC 6362 / UT26 / NBRC 101211 / UT26S) TaxID=452662 RepID=D4Z7Q3_SPHIU|nr:fumarylacetoacetase [Sphingobium indicum]BAI98522.1 fumarylacetoacetase [Sphingobium indicum UT26S]BDD68577.1 fumarylacetoacetase [Sphingobium sp. TA15]
MSFPRIDETHDPARSSWVEGADGHPAFPIQNLPYGIFSPPGGAARAGVAIGERIFDLRAAAQTGLLPAAASAVFGEPTLNALMALPAADRLALRRWLSALFSDEAQRPATEPLLHRAADCALHLPATIGDYSDFYVGIHHATNIGRLFRPDNPLLPNYKYVPIGYHGRASSIRPSGVPVVRPRGQRKPPEADAPVVGPSQRLDYELELGIWIGAGNALGETVPIADAADHIAGFCLLNDWSARDFQAWEYVPLGPFLAKNFQSTISPWVVTAEAMAPFRIAQPPRPQGDPQPLPYLWDEADQAQGALAIDLEVHLSSAKMRAEAMPPMRLSRGPAFSMYWTAQQIVAHHASNGCNLNPGDLLGTGTLSGPTPDSFGSLMELTGGGQAKIVLPTGEERAFLEDGDELALSAVARADGYVSIGFGECRAMIAPAR